MGFKDVKKNDTYSTSSVKTVDPVEDILKESVEKVSKVEESKAEPEAISKEIEYTVITNILNVRSTPNGIILRQVKSGDTLKGEPDQSGWIKLANGRGYVMSKYVAPKKG